MSVLCKNKKKQLTTQFSLRISGGLKDGQDLNELAKIDSFAILGSIEEGGDDARTKWILREMRKTIEVVPVEKAIPIFVEGSETVVKLLNLILSN